MIPTTNIVFFGASKYVLPLLEQLHQESTFHLALIVTTEKPDPKLSEAAWEQVAPVMHFAKTHDIAYIQVQQFTNDILTRIQDATAPIAILAYFGIIVKKEVLDLFPKGIINVHPSLLPLYRGSTPGQTAILNGDTKTGVTIMQLDEKMDHGPILAQEEIPLLPHEDADALYTKLFTLGSTLLIKTLTAYLLGEITPAEQDHAKATTTKTLRKNDGYIDSGNPPRKAMLDRMIRAYYPWPSVFTNARIADKDIRIKLLPGEKVQPEGKKPMQYKDFINGYSEGKAILEKLGLLSS